MIIEDEENIRKLTGTNLAASSYRVFTAGNGRDGIKLARREHPDLILLDLRLPDMSGWDVLMKFKADRELEKTRVMIVTATVPRELEDKLPGVETAGYLVKPFDVDELLSKVRQALEGGM